MAKLISLAALVGGLWLVYLGYERQHSLAGSADSAVSKISQKIDGDEHFPVHMRYYACGAVLVLAGAFGLGAGKR